MLLSVFPVFSLLSGLAPGIAADLDSSSTCLAQPMAPHCGPTVAAAAFEESSLLQFHRAQAVPASAATPYLDLAQAELRRLAPGAEGKVWKLTHGNVLPEKWLLQTPDCWGLPGGEEACTKHNAPGTKRLAQRIQDEIASAKEWVDLATLDDVKDMATGIFEDSIVQGLVKLYMKNPHVTIRILGGKTPYVSDGSASFFLDKLIKNISAVANGGAAAAQGLRIFVASIETYIGWSWNHAKIIAVDGRSAIVGGHNLWGEAYNSDHPVTDVSMQVEGPAAGTSHHMANVLWGFACSKYHVLPVPSAISRAEFVRATAVANDKCPNSYSPPEAPAMGGSVSILAVGEMGLGMKPLDNDLSKFKPPPPDSEVACLNSARDDFNYQARYAVDNPDWAAIFTVIGSAKRSIFISQQDVLREICFSTSTGFAPAKWSVRLMDTIGQKLMDGVNITMVVSTPMKAPNHGKGSDGYSLMDNLVDIPKVLLPRMCLNNQTTDCRAYAKDRLCEFLKLASVRVSRKMPTWKSDYAIALHSKVFLVDDTVFYIGSRNLYPSPLQNFGYIVEDAMAAQHFKASFFDPLWTYSKDSAIVDRDAGVAGICSLGDV